MTDQITVPRATWDAMREANVQWIDAYAKLRMERDSLKKEAELGNIAMRFVDRAGDVADCDPAERICSEFHEAMSEAVDRLYVQPRSALTAANAVSAEPQAQREIEEWLDANRMQKIGSLHHELVALFAAHPQATEPAGYKLVPVEPTQEMLDAVVTTLDDHLLGPDAEKQYREDWAAMLAAAPEAKQ